MPKSQSYGQVRLCEECGQPMEHGRGHEFLCRRCEEALERNKRRAQQTRQSRRDTRRSREDW